MSSATRTTRSRWTACRPTRRTWPSAACGDADGRVYVIRIKATDTSNNMSYSYCTVVVPHGQSKSSLSAVNAQAAAAVAAFVANGDNPPAGFFLVGDGPIVGPKQ